MHNGPLTTLSARSQTEAGFPPTEWSLVLQAGRSSSPESTVALERLCRGCWPAVYGFLRRHGFCPADAQDLTQDFLVCLMRRGSLATAEPAKGRFRSFLLGALKHFLADARKRSHAQRRGGGDVVLSLDEREAEECYAHLAARELPPDQCYDRQWAWGMLERTLAALQEECARFGQAERFEILKPFLVADADQGDYDRCAATLRLTPSAVAVAIHRLRKRYRLLIRQEVARTVSDPSDLEAELRHLFGSR